MDANLSDKVMEQWEQKQSRDDLRFGQLMLTIASANGMTRKGGGKLSIKDFVPDYVSRKIKESPKVRAINLGIALKAAAKRDQNNGRK